MPTRIQVVHQHDPILDLVSSHLHWLTEDELARYQAITSAQRKKQFLAGHFLARKMASLYYANKVEDWIYSVDENNQRRIKCRQSGMPEFRVSLSHSADWIAVAISTTAVGIDIETFGKQRDFIAIASHVFSASETAYLKSLAPDKLNRQFYLYWTLKECVAKQNGDGLKFEVSRSHRFIQETNLSTALIHSWQCAEYVVSMSGNPNGSIETLGVCDNAEALFWKNVST